MSDEEYEILTTSDDSVHWFCARCRQIKSNKIKWGEHSGEEDIRRLITSTYDVIIGWKKNIFQEMW